MKKFLVLILMLIATLIFDLTAMKVSAAFIFICAYAILKYLVEQDEKLEEEQQMAHDFEIRVKGAPEVTKTRILVIHDKNGKRQEVEEYKDIAEGYYAYFFGYAEGLMYIAFNATEHCYGFSGDGKEITISREEALKGLKKAITKFDTIDYPDPTRMDDIKAFYARMETDFKDYQEFIICFS